MDALLRQFFRHLEQDQDLPASYREAWEQDLRDFSAFLQDRGLTRWQDVTPGEIIRLAGQLELVTRYVLTREEQP